LPISCPFAFKKILKKFCEALLILKRIIYVGHPVLVAKTLFCPPAVRIRVNLYFILKANFFRMAFNWVRFIVLDGSQEKDFLQRNFLQHGGHKELLPGAPFLREFAPAEFYFVLEDECSTEC
jgi:hypothetical protein